MVHFLLQSGADVNVRTSKGELPIDVATSAEIMKMLGGEKLVPSKYINRSVIVGGCVQSVPKYKFSCRVPESMV